MIEIPDNTSKITPPTPGDDTMSTTQNHHTAKREVTPGIWQVSRPLRDTSWWHRRKSERACRRNVGHCWHPEGLIDWWCCMCSAETGGMPAHRCAVCASEKDRLHQEPAP